MPNTIITPTMVAKASVRILNNILVAGNNVYRGYESEFDKQYNGYKVGQTVNVRKPTMFTVRTGPNAANQDVVEGYTQVKVDTQIGVDFAFNSTELTLQIGDLAERVLKPAMVTLANRIDTSVLNQYTNFWNWVGTPGTQMASYLAMARAGQRLDDVPAPSDDRVAFLSTNDQTGMVANLAGTFIQQDNKSAYRTGELGEVDNITTFRTQNVGTLTTGTRTNGTVGAANQQVTYAGAQANTWTQTLAVTGLGNASTVAAGDVFTIANVFMINQVTKIRVGNTLQQFTVVNAATADAAGAATLTISPAIITTGAFQTVALATGTNLPAGGVITWAGAASTGYSQNLAIHKNAIALTVVPMELPPGAVNPARESYNGLSVRVIPYYNGTNDISNWRLDLLYGVQTIDPRLGTRIAG